MGEPKINYSEWCKYVVRLNKTVSQSDGAMGTAGALYLIVFGVFNSAFYFSVLMTVFKNRKDFKNPFHKCMMALGVCDLFILFYLDIYAPISVMMKRKLFGFYLDIVLSALYNTANWSAHEFQALYAVNRFCGVVFFRNYRSIFKNRNLYAMIAACYLFGLISIAFWLFFGYPFLDTELGITLFTIQIDPHHPMFGHVAGTFEGLIMLLPVLLNILILYPVTFAFVKKRKTSVPSDKKSDLSVEVKLLLVGAIQGALFFFGYSNFGFMCLSAPLWVNFHVWVFYVAASPYLYLIFDRKLRRKYIKGLKGLKQSSTVVPTDNTPSMRT